jgi:hypothetical protein
VLQVLFFIVVIASKATCPPRPEGDNGSNPESEEVWIASRPTSSQGRDRIAAQIITIRLRSMVRDEPSRRNSCVSARRAFGL